MITHRHGDRTCPACAAKLNASTVLAGKDAPPRPGDLTLCIRCAVVLEFRDDLELRTAPDETIDQLPARDRAALSRMQSAIMEVQSRQAQLHGGRS